MDVFALRDRLIGEYASYIGSFINIADARIRQHVDGQLKKGLLWPDPLIQLNPTFEPGAWISDLVAAGRLHSECASIFRIKGTDGSSKPLRLHRHQTDAIEAARSGDSYVLTTGTGSGKSLAYIIPIVDFVLRHGSGKGIRAVVVYPMNALANSQYNELEKFLCRGYPPQQPPVTFRRYTGQEKEEEREEILANPPDILLTNYVMLELMLTRPREQRVIRAARGVLHFLVLDELHTYRGRQGADVSLLARRVREVSDNPQMQCVGTSATLAGGGTLAEQQVQIAEVASRIFGVQVKSQRVIGETLRRATVERPDGDPATVSGLRGRLQGRVGAEVDGYDAFIADPLNGWIESTFGLSQEPSSDRLRRAQPISICGQDGAAQKLAAATGVPTDVCEAQIQRALLAGYDVTHPDTGAPVFPFRLHQFISRGDTVYASLDAPDQRYITTQGQQYVPADRSRVLLPLAFCRECGQEYFTVLRYVDRQTGAITYRPRDAYDQSGEEDATLGFLYPDYANPWPSGTAEEIDRLPEDWLEVSKGVRRVKASRKASMPLPVQVDALGEETEQGAAFHFLRSPFSFCLSCGVSYGGRERSDYGKLASLTSEGRSTATTVLSLSTIRALREDADLPKEARKLLSFTDNRQDASLQAGHFNDFVEIGLLRGALCRAVHNAGSGGISHEVLSQRVFEALALPKEAYAADSTVKFQAERETQRALREVLAYRIYHDLRRGWRVTSPNLEQCALLRIEYGSLDELCEAGEYWDRLHPALADAIPALRQKISTVLLDYLRRELAIRVDYLNPVYQESLQQLSSQRLAPPWAIDEGETMIHGFVAFPRSKEPGDSEESIYVSGRGGFGLYLRRTGTLPHLAQKLSVDETELVIRQLLETLRQAGLVEVVAEPHGGSGVPGYQIPASALIWHAGNGKSPFHDPIRMPQQSNAEARVNEFFRRLYQDVAPSLVKMEAREHTAQVDRDERIARESRFRDASLPILYCSPTMELGVDIAQLNAVNMRNVPPTPANYAQRSGRAGRSGQPALVFTYCTTGSSHDQYFFKRPAQMVAGSVTPPRLDLANEDLVGAHVHAVWLAETSQSLGSSLAEVLDVAGEDPSLDVLPSVRTSLHSAFAKDRARRRLDRILATVSGQLADADWYDDEWLQRTLDQAETRFDRACDRWRTLYRAALAQRATQNKVIGDASRSAVDKQQAKRLRAEAESQMELLTQSQGVDSDFYSYRYFASEGFLPGYNFPRLPLSAYLPASRKRKNDRDEYLSRSRFLAVSEFGPRSIIYHEGSRYIVNKVILPVEERSEEGLLTSEAKLCPRCGYLHPVVSGEQDWDVCEQCNALLGHPLRPLFRMQNVSTKRRDRINSDEEERQRMGYDLQTAVRFAPGKHGSSARKATVAGSDGTPLLRLSYGHSATIWRINLGWRRRSDPEVYGFLIDSERGYWATNKNAVETDPEDPMSPAKQRVVPYVEDWRNCLLIEPLAKLSAEVMASLQPALKNAIQVLYQVEDAELAAEPLPSENERRLILLYESAEGGAGVLRQLLASPDAVRRVAAKALELCHYDAQGNDLGSAPGARERCEAACYDCLMSYTNQRDHALLDRTLIRDILLALSQSEVQASPSAASRSQHLARLKGLCDSDLERKWLDFLEERNLRLPDEAQKLVEACRTRSDFWYAEPGAAVFVDGPVHDQPDVKAEDERIDACVQWDCGLTVVRFHCKADWAAICAENAAVFGKGES